MVFMRAQWSSVWRVSCGFSNIRPLSINIKMPILGVKEAMSAMSNPSLTFYLLVGKAQSYT